MTMSYLSWRSSTGERQTDRQTDTDRQTEKESLKWDIGSSFFSVKAKLKCSHGRSFVSIYVAANKKILPKQTQLHLKVPSTTRGSMIIRRDHTCSQLLNYKHIQYSHVHFTRLPLTKSFLRPVFYNMLGAGSNRTISMILKQNRLLFMCVYKTKLADNPT